MDCQLPNLRGTENMFQQGEGDGLWVPQGVVLGPFLFMINMNDMPKEADSYPNMFVDDTNIMKEVRSIRDHKISK